MNEHGKPGNDPRIVEIPDLVESLAKDPDAIARNAAKLAAKDDRTSDPPEQARRNG